jgi:lysyl-tRNA synthetase class 2
VSERERESRRERLVRLRAAGVDPYPARVGPREAIAAVRGRHDDHDAAWLEAHPERVAVAGRILAVRTFGKLLFFSLVENGASLQASARAREMDPAVFDFARSLDVGDFVRVEGPVWRTRTGELTVDVRGVDLLAKSLRPLPEKWHGLADVELRFRRRYLDLLVNEDARRIALVRSRSVAAMRAALEPLYGGATARPFATHHALYDQKLYLRISDELYLKRLVVGGLDRVYEIAHNFRNEGVSKKHNPEFTMMECYQAYADYGDMMELVQALLRETALRVHGTARIEYRGEKIDLGAPWPRISLCEAVAEATGVDVLAAADLGSLREAVRGRGLDPGDAPTWATLVDALFSAHVEPRLVQPTLVVDYPRELSPLAKRSAADPRLVERFEAFVAGMEIANAFSELNDPDDQRERLLEQAQAHAGGDEEAHPLDEEYLLALEYGLPPTGGLGVGVDRVVMLLADAPHIREVLLFPHLRPEGA